MWKFFKRFQTRDLIRENIENIDPSDFELQLVELKAGFLEDCRFDKRGYHHTKYFIFKYSGHIVLMINGVQERVDEPWLVNYYERIIAS